MADVEMHSILHSLAHFGYHAAARIEDAARVTAEAVRDHVAFLEHGDDILDLGVRAADVHHDGQLYGVSGFTRQLERFEIVVSGDIVGQSDLHAQDHIPILLDGLYGDPRIAVAQVEQFTPGHISRKR